MGVTKESHFLSFNKFPLAMARFLVPCCISLHKIPTNLFLTFLKFHVCVRKCFIDDRELGLLPRAAMEARTLGSKCQ